MSPAAAEESKEDVFEEEKGLEEEQDFPDLVRADDTGGLIDEFEFLEEALAVDEVKSASKYRQSIFWSPSAITVITRKDIQSSGANTIPEILRRVPGMDIYLLKPGYTLVGARCRSFEYNNKVLLLVDGREELIEMTGFAFWNFLSIDLEEIERIEVIRGPGSALYGANALAAVVSITTMAERQESGGSINVSAGEYGRGRIFGRVRDALEAGGGSLSYSLGVGLEEEHSPSDPRDESLSFLRTHGFLRYQAPSGLDVSLHGGLVTGTSMIYLFAGDARLTDMLIPWGMAKLAYAFSDKTRLAGQVYFHRVDGLIDMRTDLYAFDMWIADLPDMDWVSNTVDGQFQFEWQIQDGLLFVGGGNLRYSNMSGEIFLLDDDDELRGAGVAHLELTPWENFKLTLGLRIDANELTGMAFSPRAVVVVKPWPNQSFRLGYGLAFRKPAFLESRVHIDIQNHNSAMPEIVDKMAEEFSNTDLENMKAQSIELGWRGSFLDEELWLSADAFFNIYQDRISFDTNVDMRLGLPDIENGDVHFLNIPGVYSAAGGEIDATYKPALEWTFWCNLGFRTVVELETQKETLKEPQFRLNVGGRYAPDTGLMAEVFLHGVTDYQQVLLPPTDVLRSEPLYINMGNQLLLVGRLGYRSKLDYLDVDVGLTIRAPLTENRKEFPGIPIPPQLAGDSQSEFGGEPLLRQLSFYLRASF